MTTTRTGAGNGSPQLKDRSHPPVNSIVAELAALNDRLTARRVTFWPVAHSWFRLTDAKLAPAERDEFVKLFPPLLKCFAEPRGEIITAYFCRHIPVAAVLTDIDTAAEITRGVPRCEVGSEDAGVASGVSGDAEPRPDGWIARWRRRQTASAPAIHLEPLLGQPLDWKAKELIFRCMDLHYRVLQYLQPKPRKICIRMIFSIIVALLGTLDHPPGHRRNAFGTDVRAVESLEAELEQARLYSDRSAQHQAQVDYFKGMAGGLVVLLVALIFLGWLSAAPDVLKEPLLAAPLAGGAGAIVSVMTRMTRDQLVLNYESGTATIRLLGLLRPLLGALFGGALYLLLAGGLVTVAQTPNDATKLIYFYTGIAFVAGFSERWAQDVVTGKSRALPGEPSSTPPSGRANPQPRVPGAR